MVLELTRQSVESVREGVESRADALDDFTDKSSSQSFYDAVADVVGDSITKPIVQRSRQLAESHVGEGRTQYIRGVQGEWIDNKYIGGLTSDNVVVLSHEYGSGMYNGGGEYEITPTRSEHLGFMGSNGLVTTSIVMHPGVRGKHSMRRALREQSEMTARRAMDNAADQLRELLDSR